MALLKKRLTLPPKKWWTVSPARAGVVGSVLLVAAGLMLMCIGLHMIYPPVGWMAAGLGVFYLESRIFGARRE